METTVPTGFTNKSDVFFRRRHNGTICFVLAVLLFFLPFAEFRCGNMPMIGNTGFGIAAGQQWKAAASWNTNEITQKLGELPKAGKGVMKDSPNIFAIVALAAGLFGAGIAFSELKWRSMAGMCAGILGALMLLALLIQFKIEMKSMLGKEAKAADYSGMNLGGIVNIHFTTWYWSALLLFIAAAFFNYMRDKLILRDAIDAAIDFEFQQKQVS